jgi:cobalt-zinc-cadmium resistance protein CzcA
VIERIIESALRQRVFVAMAAMLLIAAGVWSALRLPIDAVPDITNVQVVINTIVPALSPEEVEKQVSFPIEMAMTGIQGLEDVRSLSKFGLSQITIVFAEGTDIFRARQLVNERLGTVTRELPVNAQPALGTDFPPAWAKSIFTRSITSATQRTSRRRGTNSFWSCDRSTRRS